MAPDTPRRRTFADVADALFGPREPDPLQLLADSLGPPDDPYETRTPKPPTERGWWEDSAWSEYKSAFWDDNGSPDVTREVDTTFENEVRPR